MKSIKLARMATLLGMIGSIIQTLYILYNFIFRTLNRYIDSLYHGYNNLLNIIIDLVFDFIYLFSVFAVVAFFIMMFMYYNKKLAKIKSAHNN